MKPAGNPRSGYLALAELALVGVSASILYSFVRLFGDMAFLATLVPVVVFAHAVTILLRRTGVGLAVTALVSVTGFVLLATWLWFPQTTTALLPTPGTLEALKASLDNAWTAFDQITTPVPSDTGFLVIGGAVLFCAIFLADWAAFRLWSPMEAIVGYFALYLFGVLLGTEGQQIGTAVAFAAAVGLFLLACRAVRLASETSWLTAGRGRAVRWLATVGASSVLLAVALGTVIGPLMPGTGEAALVDWRQDREQSNRIVVSPLVEIRGRLVQQSNLEAFSVESPQAAYWRLTALDTFDGSIWRSGGRYAEADGGLDAAQPGDVGADEIEQRFTITNLGATWLPAAYQPTSIDVEGTTVRYQASSSTLIVDNDVPSSDELAYRVVSELPRPTAEQLERSELSVPADLAHQTSLPADLSDEVRSLAGEVAATAGASTPYEEALALQAFFRDQGPFAYDDHSFTYVLGSSDEGHGGDAMVDFLASGEGYCEQFAGTYAAMARVLGLPARVAVGFTWGDPDPENPNRYIVRGRHAHAWPEVWLGEDVGWVAFEPTPGRGSPTMGDYSDVAPSQAAVGSPAATEPLAPERQAPDPDLAPTGPREVEPGAPPSEDLSTSTAPSPGPTGPAWPAALTIVGLALLGATALYLVAIPALRRWATRRRRALAGADAGARVQVAWDESEESLALLGLMRSASETHEEFAARAGRQLSSQAANLGGLAAASEAASYGPHAPSPVLVASAEQAAQEIDEEVRQSLGRGGRLRTRLDPRSAWRALRGSATPRA